MKIRILSIGKIKQKHIETGILDYLNRLKHFVKCTVENVPDIKNKHSMPNSEIIKRESEALESKIQSKETIILMDINGIQMDSIAFSKYLENKLLLSNRDTVFVIGGAFGVSESLKQKADYSLSLSPLTFTHEMIQLILLEQIYRGFTIMKNVPYHH